MGKRNGYSGGMDQKLKSISLKVHQKYTIGVRICQKNNRFTDERLVRLLSSMRTAGGLLLQNEDWEALVNRPKGHLT